MTSQEMMRHPPIGKGYCFRNVARIDETPDWRVELETPAETKFLFGYDPKDLLAKQYR